MLEPAFALLKGARRIAVLTGAGVSAESGIPTFRGLGGLWKGRDPLSLATPEAFGDNPSLVWEFYNWRRDLVSKARPNPAHFAIAALGRRQIPLTLITQNVDRLHQRADSAGVLEVHGNLFNVRCTGCGETTDREGEVLPPLPRCESCGELLRPGVVWFGESLPTAVWKESERAVEAADLLLVVGTSAVVYPAAGLVETAIIGGAKVIEINPDPSAVSWMVDVAVPGKAGEVLPELLAMLERSDLDPDGPTRPPSPSAAT